MNLFKIFKELEIDYKGEDFEVSSLETLKDADETQVSFFSDTKLLDDLKRTKAGAVILKQEYVEFLPSTCRAILSTNPYLDMARMSKWFAKKPFNNGEENSISDKAKVDKRAVIGAGSIVEEGAYIMAGVVIGANATIGKNTTIFPNVVIYDDTLIGENCSIQAGAIIGSDGYGYAHTKEGEHVKIYHTGNVVLEDDVEIGANTTVDRAVFGSTRIGKNTKIDNLVQIGHNCELGAACLIVSQTGLAGSTSLGRNVVMGGQSASTGHLRVGDFVQIAARGAATKSIDGGEIYGGFPIMLQKDWLRSELRMRKYFKKSRRVET